MRSGFLTTMFICPAGRASGGACPSISCPVILKRSQSIADEVGDKLVIRYGIEVDYDPRTQEHLAEVLRSYPFDYVIGSVHFVDDFPVDEQKKRWDTLTENERNDIIRKYWDLITQMAQSGLFDIAAHLDLYKKFGALPTIDLSTEIAGALDAIAKSGMSTEINTAGWHMPDILEAYPSPAILGECHKRGIPLLITADAHKPANLTRSYDEARETGEEVGYTNVAAYSARLRSTIVTIPMQNERSIE